MRTANCDSYFFKENTYLDKIQNSFWQTKIEIFTAVFRKRKDMVKDGLALDPRLPT